MPEREPRAPEPRVAVRQLESVKVAEMDEEHERCADAMEVLVRDRSVASLRRVLQEFEAHFRHEEELLDQHLYSDVLGKAVEGFSADASARKSHFADHKRILTDIGGECERCNSLKRDGGDAAETEALVSETFAAHVVAEFEKHADQYDGHYADRMAESIAKTGGGSTSSD